MDSASSNHQQYFNPEQEYSNEYQKSSKPKQEHPNSKPNHDYSSSKPQPTKTDQQSQRNFNITIDLWDIIVIIAVTTILVPIFIFRNEIIEIASILSKVIMILFNIIQYIVFIAERIIPTVVIISLNIIS